MNLADIRKSYLLHKLDELIVGDDPILFFLRWLSEAIEGEVQEPTAMVLSTVGENSKPSSRVVLLKGCEEGEFRFFTNYNSRKGQELENNPNASLVFYWKELERQVRIEGIVSKLSEQYSTDYFNTRPFESRIGAVISPQSKVIENRDYLDKLFEEKSKEFNESGSIERPNHWGGYSLKPEMIEFWQGRASRLHDRIRFRLIKKEWTKERLAP
ncbi:MAG: pyridoxamine 5'-phosphate oxidase [Chloroflexota bacterium]|nr:pyridoxamine 5'-phosphate oxidase [Lentimicrobium sp.]